MISWGDPVYADAPAFDFDGQSAQAQAGQAGYHRDYVTLMRCGRGNNATTRSVMVVNHEYTNDEIMFRGVAGSEDLTDKQVDGVSPDNVVSTFSYRGDGQPPSRRPPRAAHLSESLWPGGEGTRYGGP